MNHNKITIDNWGTSVNELQEQLPERNIDILTVVYNRPDCVRRLIDSIREHTKDYMHYIWDNGSREETGNIYDGINQFVIANDTNAGFIIPNNRLAELGKSKYICLLNSDVTVQAGWSEKLIEWLENGMDAVGYIGCKYDENLVGHSGFRYTDIEYLEGSNLMIRRELYDKLGLFDENLIFAYSEDLEFGCKLRYNQKKQFAVYPPLIEHIGGASAQEYPCQEDLANWHHYNREYVLKKWGEGRMKTVQERDLMHVRWSDNGNEAEPKPPHRDVPVNRAQSGLTGKVGGGQFRV